MRSFWRTQQVVLLFGGLLLKEVVAVEEPFVRVHHNNTTRNGRGTLRVAAEHWPPFFEVTEMKNGTLKFSGIMWTVLNFLAVAMSFDYEIIRPPDGKWGVGNEKGEWNGMLGMVKRKEVDFALGPFGVIYEREQACDFTVPVVIDYWAAIVPIQPYQDYWIIFRPFGTVLWGILLVTTLFYISTLILSDLFFFGRKKGVKNVSHIVFFTVKNMLEESSDWIPEKYNYQKIFAATWMLSVFILAKSYSGTLASLLTVPSFPIPINSVQDLVNQEELPWIIEEGSILEQLGRVSEKDSTFYKLYEGAKDFGIIGPNCVIYRDEIARGQFGSVCERTSIDKILSDDFSEKGNCNFYVGEINLFATSFAMAFQEGSHLLPEVNTWILNILQKGLYTKWSLEIMPNKTSCTGIEAISNSMGKKDLALNTKDVFGLFLILLIGVGLSILVFLMERMGWKRILGARF